jgi:hypothetical protein
LFCLLNYPNVSFTQKTVEQSLYGICPNVIKSVLVLLCNGNHRTAMYSAPVYCLHSLRHKCTDDYRHLRRAALCQLDSDENSTVDLYMSAGTKTTRCMPPKVSLSRDKIPSNYARGMIFSEPTRQCSHDCSSYKEAAVSLVSGEDEVHEAYQLVTR